MKLYEEISPFRLEKVPLHFCIVLTGLLCILSNYCQKDVQLRKLFVGLLRFSLGERIMKRKASLVVVCLILSLMYLIPDTARAQPVELPPTWVSPDLGPRVSGLAITQDLAPDSNTYIAAGSYHTNLSLFRTTSGTPVWSHDIDVAGGYGIYGYLTDSVSISSNPVRVVAGVGRHVEVYDVNGNLVWQNQCIPQNENDPVTFWSTEVRGTAITDDASVVVVGGARRICYYDGTNGNLLATYGWTHTRETVVYVDVSQDGSYVLFSTKGEHEDYYVRGSVYLFEYDGTALVYRYRDRFTDDVVSSEMSDDGSEFIAGEADTRNRDGSQVRIYSWDGSTVTLEWFKNETNDLYSVAVADSGNWFSWGGTFKGDYRGDIKQLNPPSDWNFYTYVDWGTDIVYVDAQRQYSVFASISSQAQNGTVYMCRPSSSSCDWEWEMRNESVDFYAIKARGWFQVAAGTSHGYVYYWESQPPIADFTWSPPMPNEGHEIEFTDNSTDPDGNIVSWEWTFDFLPPSTQQNPRRTYGDNGVYNVTLKVTDNSGLTDSITKQVNVSNLCPTIDWINSTLYENEQRTHGYWKKQCDFDEQNPPPSPDHVGIKQEYIDFIAQNSIVWSGITSKEQVCENLTVGEQPGSTMVQKLRMQLITVWLNIAAKFLFIDSPLNDPLTTATSIREFINIAEDAILRKEDNDPTNDPTDDELEDLKDVADHINNDAGGWIVTDPVVGKFEAKVTDPGSDDLTLMWDLLGTGSKIVTVIYYNDPTKTPPDDPYPSPWGTYPFTIIDLQIVGFPTPPATFNPRLYVRDDDGCETSDEDPGDPWSADWTFEYDVSWRVIEFNFTIWDVSVTYLDWDSVVVPIDPITGEPIYGGGGSGNAGSGGSGNNEAGEEEGNGSEPGSGNEGDQGSQGP